MVEQHRKGFQVSTTADLRAERQIQTMAIIPDWCESNFIRCFESKLTPSSFVQLIQGSSIPSARTLGTSF